MRLCHSDNDRDDLVQQSWVKIIHALPGYSDEQKFAAFISTIVTNTVKDYWRYQNVRRRTTFIEESELAGRDSELPSIHENSVGSIIDNTSLANQLLTKEIPALPKKLRVVFLLKHESEYWGESGRLDWKTLGVLTGQSATEAWQRFDRARRLLKAHLDGNEAEHKELSDHDLETFLVWTQAQRPIKSKAVTEKELSSLLGIPLNTFKTRYRAAKACLQKGLLEHDIAVG